MVGAILARLILSALLTVIAQTVMKKGLERTPMDISIQGLYNLATNPVILLGLCFQIAAMFAWFYVLEANRLGVALPTLLALTFLFTTILDIVLWHQDVSWAFFIGFVCILSGVFIISNYSK